MISLVSMQPPMHALLITKHLADEAHGPFLSIPCTWSEKREDFASIKDIHRTSGQGSV